MNLGSEGCALKTSSFERLFCRCYAARFKLLLFIRRQDGCSSDLLCRFWCVGWITEDDEALLPALVLWPSPSSCCLLLTPPLPTPHSKFSLCSFTIRSVRSQPACRAQDSMEGTIAHSLSNSDAKSVPAVGGRRLHFKMLQRQKNINSHSNRVALLLFLLRWRACKCVLHVQRQTEPLWFFYWTVCNTVWLKTENSISEVYTC